MLSLIELIFSGVGVCGFFVENSICAIIGLIGIIICDFIDIFISGHNPTTVILACMVAIGVSIANKNLLYSFTIALCGENLIMSVFTICIISMSFMKYCFKKDKLTELDKYIELSNIVIKQLNAKNIDEAIEMTYSFYSEQGVDVDKVENDENNKFTTLSRLVMLGLDTDNIDEAIEETKKFYDSQEKEVN